MQRPLFLSRGVAGVCTMLVTAASSLGAQSPSDTIVPGAVTLPQAIAYALEHNPDLRIAVSTTDSARAERRIAASLPGPSLSSIPNTPFQYSVTVPIDITPQRTYRVRSASLGVDAAIADRADARRTLTSAVARAFYDVLLAKDRRAIAEQRRDALRQVLVSDSARVHAGDLAEHNLARSAVEFARADAGVSRSQVDLENARLGLQLLMGVPHADSGVDVVGALAYRRVRVSPDSLLAIAQHNRPDLLAADRRIQQSAAVSKEAKAAALPVPQLSYVWQPGGPFANGRNYALGLGFALPGPGSYTGARERADAGIDASRWRRQSVEMQVERDVRQAYAEFEIQRALVERYESGLLAKISESVEATRYAYDRGAASLLDLIDVIRAQQDARDDYAQALHDYWISVYTLDAAAGAPVVSP